MKFYFLMEDRFGPQFIKTLFRKKSESGLFTGRIVKARRSSISTKLSRHVTAAQEIADRIIILMDAEGKPLDDKTDEIKRHLDTKYTNNVRIVLLDQEIEEWICYSKEYTIKDGKPSDILKTKLKYQKNQLPDYAKSLDCERMQSCESFNRLLKAME